MTQQVEAVAADAPPPPFVGFYLKAQSTTHAHEGGLVSCQFRRGNNHDGYPVSGQLVVARSPRLTADLDAVCEVEVDGCSIPALLVVDPPEVSISGGSYQIVSRQHAVLEHRQHTDDLELKAIGGDVLINRRSKGAKPAWQLVKRGHSTTFSYCTTIYVGHKQAHLTSSGEMQSNEKPEGIYDAFKLDVMQSHKEGNTKNDGKNDGKTVRASKSVNKSINTIQSAMAGLSADSTPADIAAALGKISAASNTGSKKIESGMNKKDKKALVNKKKKQQVRSASMRKQGRTDKDDFHRGKGGKGGGKGGDNGKRGAARGYASGPRRDAR
jgi:hypothetical protein